MKERDDATQRGDAFEEMRTTGLLAEICRVHGEPAEHHAQRALELAKQLGDRPNIVLNTLRVATVLFYEGHHPQAERQFRALITEMHQQGESDRLDTAYQHLGKCLAEQGRHDAALGCFEQALERRTDPALRASTLAAIGEAMRLRSQS
ncbi:MAG: tetratricopeptide repeat protein [Actinomycetota bacterium]